jgi:ABC-type bacteriocin/lantibiotic exporter with double-glycine peptidase domain
MDQTDSSVANPPAPGGPLLTVRQLLRPYWISLGVLFASLLVQMGFYAALPVSFSQIIDSALPNSDWPLMWKIFAALGGGAVAFVAAGLVQDRLVARLVASLMRDLRALMFQQLQRISSKFFTTASRATSPRSRDY